MLAPISVPPVPSADDTTLLDLVKDILIVDHNQRPFVGDVIAQVNSAVEVLERSSPYKEYSKV
jgi:hypothetical protein